MENMAIYEQGKAVPIEAKKSIQAGRLKGFTDINPMWRIRKLTEMFGPCGIGWYYNVEREWLEPTETGEVAAFVRIHLYIKVDGEWSKPIVGVGGSAFVANESKGARMSDEAYKMAQTDALSVACKNLGIGAEVYWAAGETKYGAWNPNNQRPDAPPKPAAPPKTDGPMIGSGQTPTAAPVESKCAMCGKPITAVTLKSGQVLSAAEVYEQLKGMNTDGVCRCKECRAKAGTDKPKG